MVRARGGEKGRLMGRSQVVRQRILIPPFGGSSPPAPASQSGLHRYLRESLRNPREWGPIPRIGLSLGVSDSATNAPLVPSVSEGYFWRLVFDACAPYRKSYWPGWPPISRPIRPRICHRPV